MKKQLRPVLFFGLLLIVLIMAKGSRECLANEKKEPVLAGNAIKLNLFVK